MPSSRRSTPRWDARRYFLQGAELPGHRTARATTTSWSSCRLPGSHALVGRLAVARDTLEKSLGAPVSLNPLPAFQLRRGATNLYVWKLHKEGTVLFAPDGFPVERPAPFQLTAISAYSYLMTAAFVLLDAAGAPDPTAAWPDDIVTRGVRKALLNIVQLRLLRQGDYATTLEHALERSQDPGVAALLSESAHPHSWFTIRGLLLSELAAVRPVARVSRAIIRNTQYASLSRLRGQNRVAAVVRTTPFEYELGDAALRLLRAVGDDGTVGADVLDDVARHLPAWLHAPRDDWRALRGALHREWASAHALAGL